VSNTARRYAKTHEWIRVDGTVGTVGISDHAQHEVTDVVYAEVPKTGKTLKAGEEAATIESVKAAFSIYAPVSGKIVKANDKLELDPGLINKSPFEDGWMFALELSDPKELDQLMSEDEYQAFLKSGAPAH
jgi:glycine cleavage system H protein